MRSTDLFQKQIEEYRKNINPPYGRKDFISIISTLFILLVVPITVIVALQARDIGKRAEGTAEPIVTSENPSMIEFPFNGPDLSAGWQWEDPSGNASYEVSGGIFNMTVTQGDDQWISINKAPRILRNQINSTWTIETKIVSSTARGSSLVGLVIFKDPQNWFIWGQLGNNSLEGSGIIGNAFTQIVGNMSTKYKFLRIRRVGSDYFFDASADGINWTNANSYQDASGALAGARYGILGKNWSSDPDYISRFDYFREYSQDLAPSTLASVKNTAEISREIGFGAINDTKEVGVCGADLGSMFEWNGKTHIVFGDTFDYSSSSCPSNFSFDGTNNRRFNTMVTTTDTTPEDGLTFDSWILGNDNKAKQLFGESSPVTSIPTYGISVGNTAYLYYMHVNNWDPWTCDHSSIATSSDGGQNWKIQTSTIQWAPGNFNQVSLLKEGGYVYVFGIPCARNGSTKLARVAENNILDKSQYQYFAGFNSSSNPIWETNNEAAAVTVAGGRTGELSVRWNEWLGSYMMMYVDPKKRNVVIRESPNLWGPWSAPIKVLPSGHGFCCFYGAYMLPGYEENLGETIYFRMSQYTPKYSTFWMKTKLVKTPIEDIAVSKLNAPHWVNKGENVSVEVEVENRGEVEATFTTSLVASNVEVGTPQKTTLSPGAKTSFKFNWDTSTLSPNIYRLSARISTIPGDRNTSNNTKSKLVDIEKIDYPPLFHIRYPDFNNDGMVNVVEIGMVVNAFGSVFPNYNPKYDLDANGAVNIIDIGLIVAAFGTSNWSNSNSLEKPATVSENRIFKLSMTAVDLDGGPPPKINASLRDVTDTNNPQDLSLEDIGASFNSAKSVSFGFQTGYFEWNPNSSNVGSIYEVTFSTKGRNLIKEIIYIKAQ